MTSEERRLLEVPTRSGDEFIEIDVNDLVDEGTFNEVAEFFAAEDVPVQFWIYIAAEAWHRGRAGTAVSLGQQALQNKKIASDQVPLLCMLSTYYLALSRGAPQRLLDEPRVDVLKRPAAGSADHPEAGTGDDKAPELRSYYVSLAEQFIGVAEELKASDPVVRDCKLSVLLTRGKFPEAHSLAQDILSQEPLNVGALFAVAQMAFIRKQYADALRIYQKLVRLRARLLGFPDPRIGAGLGYYMLGDKARALWAWVAVARDSSGSDAPQSDYLAAQLLQGLAWLSDAHDPAYGETRRSESYRRGIAHIHDVFTRDRKNAVAATALSSYFASLGFIDLAQKLAERAVQYADTRAASSDAYLLLGRVLQVQSEQRATESSHDSLIARAKAAFAQSARILQNAPANIAHAQLLARTDELGDAAALLGNVAAADPSLVEASLLFAAVRQQSALKSGEATVASTVQLISDAHRDVAAMSDRISRARLASVKANIDYYIGLATASAFASNATTKRSGTSISVATGVPAKPRVALDAYATAYSLLEKIESIDPSTQDGLSGLKWRILNNQGVVHLSTGNTSEAVPLFEHALSIAKDDSATTLVSFNLALAHETASPDESASLYKKLLSEHPEFNDARVRLALLTLPHNKDKAHWLMKRALTSEPRNAEFRAAYAYLLLAQNADGPARDVAISTLSDVDRHDIYALCIAGLVQYDRARASKISHAEIDVALGRTDGDKGAAVAALTSRASRIHGALQFFNKALQVDPFCATAAHGIAISFAEGTLGYADSSSDNLDLIIGGAVGTRNVDTRALQLADALSIFDRLRDTWPENLVLLMNTAHCLSALREWSRAIDLYSIVENKFPSFSRPIIYSHLARVYSNRAMSSVRAGGSVSPLALSDSAAALDYADKALEVVSDDASLIYNVILVTHRACELLVKVAPAVRSVEALEATFARVESSSDLIARIRSLPDSAPVTAENLDDLADTTTSLLQQKDPALSAQHKYNSDRREKEEAAIREREQQEIAEQEKRARLQEEHRQHQEALAAQRRQIREQELQRAAELRDQEERARQEELIAAENKKEAKKKKEKKRDAPPTDAGPAKPSKRSKKSNADFINDSEDDDEEEAPVLHDDPDDLFGDEDDDDNDDENDENDEDEQPAESAAPEADGAHEENAEPEPQLLRESDIEPAQRPQQPVEVPLDPGPGPDLENLFDD